MNEFQNKRRRLQSTPTLVNYHIEDLRETALSCRPLDPSGSPAESEAKYCPVCGAVIDDVDTLNIDEDFMEEGWED